MDCVRKLSLNALVGHYQKRCRCRKYDFSKDKAKEIYGAAKELAPIPPKDDLTKLIAKQSIEQLNTASKTVEELRTLMNDTVAKLSEYPAVTGMKDVGLSLDPQSMAEIGDITRFAHKRAIIAFAGVDPDVSESGICGQKSAPTPKRGSSSPRKTLLQVMNCLIKTEPQDNPVYAFTGKKCTQGRPYCVYMTAGANELLRIYYERVKEYLVSLSEQKTPHPFRPADNSSLFVIPGI